MSRLDYTHDASTGETMDDNYLPEGEYAAAICKSSIHESKKNPRNRYVSLEFQVTEGPKKSRRFWTMLNLWNVNDEAVVMARREFNSICRAIGRLKVEDTEELHGIPMLVTLGVRDTDRGKQNSVRNYKPLNGKAPAQQQQASGGQSSSGSEDKAPWDD